MIPYSNCDHLQYLFLGSMTYNYSKQVICLTKLDSMALTLHC